MPKTKTIVFCPTCSKKVLWGKSDFRPFCSKRCRLIDLGDWASEKFKIPGEKTAEKHPNLPEEEENNPKKQK